jgi:hypothetical protein
MDKDLAHFLRLARRGQSEGASAGEYRAAILATAILGNIPVMDLSAILGAVDFITLVHRDATSAAAILENPANE